MKLTFRTDAALVAFGDMAEGMEETARDDGDRFEADQYADVTLTVWNAVKSADGAVVVDFDDGRTPAVQSILENLADTDTKNAAMIEAQ
jgi:hypothetical protein